MAYRVFVYRNDLVLEHPPLGLSPGLPKRGECGGWSQRSRDRLAFVASNSGIAWKALITLTYPANFPTRGKMVKKHLNTFLVALRRATAPSEALCYLWFLEFQKRGAPHVHILVNLPLADMPPKQWFSDTWYRVVGSQDIRHLRAGTRVEELRNERSGAHYAVKYAKKMQQKAVPKGFAEVGRFWAHSRNVAPWPSEMVQCSTLDDVKDLVAGWPHTDVIDNPYVNVLYNAAEFYQKRKKSRNPGLDRIRNPC